MSRDQWPVCEPVEKERLSTWIDWSGRRMVSFLWISWTKKMKVKTGKIKWKCLVFKNFPKHFFQNFFNFLWKFGEKSRFSHFSTLKTVFYVSWNLPKVFSIFQANTCSSATTKAVFKCTTFARVCTCWRARSGIGLPGKSLGLKKKQYFNSIEKKQNKLNIKIFFCKKIQNEKKKFF